MLVGHAHPLARPLEFRNGRRYFGIGPKSIYRSKIAGAQSRRNVVGVLRIICSSLVHCSITRPRSSRRCKLAADVAEKCRFRLTPRRTERQTCVVLAPTAPEARGDRHQDVTWRQRQGVAASRVSGHLRTSLPPASRDNAPVKRIASKNRDRRGRCGLCAVVTREGGGNVHRPT